MIDNDLLAFIRSLRSVWTVELATLLRRNAGRGVAPEELIRELRASDRVVSDGLELLQAAGIVVAEHDGTYRYAPASPTIEDLVQRLEKLHRDRPTAVTRAMFSAPSDKLQSFADAFRLKKD